MRCIEFGNPILYIIGANAGILMIILCSKISLLIFNKMNFDYKYLIYLGKNTIIILYLHRLFDGLDKVFIIPNLPFSSFALNMYTFIVSILFMIIAIPMVKFINKYCSFIIGRNPVLSSRTQLEKNPRD